MTGEERGREPGALNTAPARLHVRTPYWPLTFGSRAPPKTQPSKSLGAAPAGQRALVPLECARRLILRRPCPHTARHRPPAHLQVTLVSQRLGSLAGFCNTDITCVRSLAWKIQLRIGQKGPALPGTASGPCHLQLREKLRFKPIFLT